jgi:diacylglycerol kinase family enzyme
VLLINPRSGDGKAVRAALAQRARERGIEPIVLGPGDDLAALAAQALDGGADALGMAGGDGSLATAAAAATERDVPFICIPAGTRNHFALDLGIVRHDLVGALDAFTDGLEPGALPQDGGAAVPGQGVERERLSRAPARLAWVTSDRTTGS